MKKLPALIASLVVTALVACLMLAIGVNALLTPNQTAAASAPATDSVSASTAAIPANGSTDTTSATQIKQLQDRLAQYQAREKQYQQQLDQAKQEITQANQQVQQANSAVQQYQQVLDALQQAGIIRIGSDGSIRIPRVSRSNGFFDGGGDDGGNN